MIPLGTIHKWRDGYRVLLTESRTAVVAPTSRKMGMLEVSELHHNGEVVGYFMYTGYRTVLSEAYLVAYMATKAGAATESKVLLRDKQFSIVDLPGAGTMALSGNVLPEMESLFQEQ